MGSPRSFPIVFALATLAVLIAEPATAQEDFETGVRATAMGDAFVAVANDATGPASNPAGLADIRSTEVLSQFDRLTKKLDDGSSASAATLAFVQPVRRAPGHAWGMSAHNFKGASSFRDRTWMLTYAMGVGTVSSGRPARWSIGANLRYWRRQYEGNTYTSNALQNGVASGRPDPLFADHGSTAKTVSLDAGVLGRITADGRWRIGASASNLNRPDGSLENAGDRKPLIWRVGPAFQRNRWLFSGELRHAKRLMSRTDQEWSMGMEHTVGNADGAMVKFRAGYKAGSRELRQASVGFGFQLGGVRLDYTFVFPIDGVAGMSRQRVGVSFLLPTPAQEKTALVDRRSTHARAEPPDNQSEEKKGVVNFQDDTARYFEAKAAGASASERLKLLEQTLRRYAESGENLEWVYRELGSL